MIQSCASLTSWYSSFAFQHNYLFKGARHPEAPATQTPGGEPHSSPPSLLCSPVVGMCGDLLTSSLWKCGPKSKTFKEAPNLDKEVLMLSALILPVTPPSPPPRAPVRRPSPQAEGAQPRTSLCSGPGVFPCSQLPPHARPCPGIPGFLARSWNLSFFCTKLKSRFYLMCLPYTLWRNFLT